MIEASKTLIGQPNAIGVVRPAKVAIGENPLDFLLFQTFTAFEDIAGVERGEGNRGLKLRLNSPGRGLFLSSLGHRREDVVDCDRFVYCEKCDAAAAARAGKSSHQKSAQNRILLVQIFQT